MIKTAKILTIDDEPAIREIIATYLEDNGFQVIEAANGQDGITKCWQEWPDLVLCDLRMPGMDGIEVLAAITRELPEMPIIVVSGAGSIGDAIEALKLGAWDYVTKPIEDMATLKHAVVQALERARLIRENREYSEHLESVNKQLKQSLAQLEQDEEAGRQIQFQLLPKNGLCYGPYEFTRYLLTSLYLSGDFVDYFAIDTDHLGFYMVDVSGHGVSSAFVTVLLRSHINRYLETYWQNIDNGILDPAATLSRLNQEIHQSHLGKYLTMLYGIIDRSRNRLRYSSGGQFPFPILFDGEQPIYLESKGLPIGLFDFACYHTRILDLPPAFALLVISDGILETLNQTTLQNKLNFLLSTVKSFDIDVNSLIERLALDQGNTLPDDITMLLIKRTP